MDKRKALDIIDAMIKAESGSTDPLKALRDRIVSIQNSSVQPLMKAIMMWRPCSRNLQQWIWT